MVFMSQSLISPNLNTNIHQAFICKTVSVRSITHNAKSLIPVLSCLCEYLLMPISCYFDHHLTVIQVNQTIVKYGQSMEGTMGDRWVTMDNFTMFGQGFQGFSPEQIHIFHFQLFSTSIALSSSGNGHHLMPAVMANSVCKL